jgi:hypothetical protein
MAINATNNTNSSITVMEVLAWQMMINFVKQWQL